MVLVVTHDRDFGQRYGDRIIEIKDGEVIADTGDEISPLKEDDNNYEIIISFPTGLALKMITILVKESKDYFNHFIAILTIFWHFPNH